MRQIHLKTPSLLNVLRATLRHLEEELGPNDATLLALKQTIVQIIAELELEKSQKLAA